MNQKVVLFIIVAAAIVAIGGFLLVSFIVDGEPDPTPTPAPGDTLTGVRTMVVNGVSITIRYDPNKEVTLISVEPATPVPPVDLPPTETPTPAVITPTPDPGGGTSTGNVTPPPPVNPTPRPASIVFVPYTVLQGDTYFSIATFHQNNNYATSVVLIGKHVPASDLVAGNVIQVPVGNPAYCPAPYRPYVVLEGDTAFRIAQKVGTTPDELRRINGLDANYTVHLSDVICVP